MTALFRDLAAVLADCLEVDGTAYVGGANVQFVSAVIDAYAPGNRPNSPRFNSVGIVAGGALTVEPSETVTATVTIEGADNAGMSNAEVLKTATLGVWGDTDTYGNGCVALDLGQLGENLTHVRFTVDVNFSGGAGNDWAVAQAICYGYADRSDPGT